MTTRYRTRNVCRSPTNPRYAIERHDKEHDELEGVFKEKLYKAAEKRAKEVQARIRRVVWFIIGSHILMVFEYYYIWRHILP